MRLKELVIGRDAKLPKVVEETLEPINVREITRRWNKPMMKHEFDALVGITTDPECYKKIEAVYMQFDEMFPTKEAIASFYKKHDMNGIERMYREALKIQQLEQQLKALQCPVIVTKPAPENEAAFKELLDVLNKHGWCKSVLMPVDIPVPVKPTEGSYKYEFPKWRSQYQQEPITQLAFSATQLDTLINSLASAKEEYICPHDMSLRDLVSASCAGDDCEKCWRAALKEVEVKK